MQAIPILAAVVPVLLIMAYWSIRDQHIPLREAVWASFGLGILVVYPVVALEAFYWPQIKQIGDAHLYSFMISFFGAALPEETAKLLIVFYFSLRHEDLTRPIDALILAVAVSLGFAVIENVFYVIQSESNWGTIAILRAFSAVPMHGATGVLMGYFAARKLAETEHYRRYVVLMLLVPVLMHGVYDYPHFLEERTCDGSAELAVAFKCGSLRLLIVVIILVFGILALIAFRKCPGPHIAVEGAARDRAFDDPLILSDQNEHAPPNEQEKLSQTEPKNSGFGIAAFVISIVAGGLLLITLYIGGVIETSTPGGIDEKSTQGIMIGFAVSALFIAELVAFGLGIGGLFQKQKAKFFAILGMVISGASIVVTALLTAIGNAVE